MPGDIKVSFRISKGASVPRPERQGRKTHSLDGRGWGRVTARPFHGQATTPTLPSPFEGEEFSVPDFRGTMLSL